MKNLLHLKIIAFVIVFCLIKQNVFAQKTEINFNVYSGIFSFKGSGAASVTGLSNVALGSLSNIVINPYGTKNNFSYSLELQLQKITKSKFTYGAGLSFESLNSSATINTVEINGLGPARTYVATGESKIKNSFITLNPFVGNRFTSKKINVDLLAGIDVGFCLNSHVSATAIYETAAVTGLPPNYATISLNNELSKPSVDICPRIQAKLQYKKYGFIAGYSLGLTNYQSSNNAKATTSFFRLGLSYQLK